eukprot:9482047-Pyramimonas_sp.AAC.1
MAAACCGLHVVSVGELVPLDSPHRRLLPRCAGVACVGSSHGRPLDEDAGGGRGRERAPRGPKE